MTVLKLIDEADRQVPAMAPFGTRWKGTCQVRTTQGMHTVAVAARIDACGRRHEQFWCDEVRLERALLLRLTCSETECPHASEVRAQWRAFKRGGPEPRARPTVAAGPLMNEVALTVGRHHVTARPARFPCFMPCPNNAHPPITLHKTGYDLFEHGVCIGGGVVQLGAVRRPRLPTVQAAEAYVLARHLEALVVLGQAAGPSPQART